MIDPTVKYFGDPEIWVKILFWFLDNLKSKELLTIANIYLFVLQTKHGMFW